VNKIIEEGIFEGLIGAVEEEAGERLELRGERRGGIGDE